LALSSANIHCGLGQACRLLDAIGRDALVEAVLQPDD